MKLLLYFCSLIKLSLKVRNEGCNVIHGGSIIPKSTPLVLVVNFYVGVPPHD